MICGGNPDGAFELVHHGQYHLHPDQIRVQLQVSLDSALLHGIASEHPSSGLVTPFLTTPATNAGTLYVLGDEEQTFVPVMRFLRRHFGKMSRPGPARFGVDPGQRTRGYAERCVPPIVCNDLPICIVKRNRIVWHQMR